MDYSDASLKEKGLQFNTKPMYFVNLGARYTTMEGKETFSLSYNDVFKQMQLSEDNWIEINNKTLPINVSSSSLAFKTQLNDKVINYTIEIEFAYDTINNIR